MTFLPSSPICWCALTLVVVTFHYSRCAAFSLTRKSSTFFALGHTRHSRDNGPIRNIELLVMKNAPSAKEEDLKWKNNGNDNNNPFADSGFSLGAGVAGLFILLGNRLLSIDSLDVSDVQSRADIISVIACSALLLNAISESDIETKEREKVSLFGFALKDPLILKTNFRIDGGGGLYIKNVDKIYDNTLWLINTILGNTPATSVHVVVDDICIGRGGVVGKDDALSLDIRAVKDGSNNGNKMAILQKSLDNSEEVYLPDLQILPAKIEFSYIPINAQSVLIVPFGKRSAVVVATNQAKVLKVKDLNRVRSAIKVFKAAVELR